MKVSRAVIAKEAGVTPTTVTCVLNNTRPVSDKIRRRVMEAIDKLNYVPDIAARAMLGKGSKQICVMVDSIKNPFFAELVYSMEAAGIEKGFFFSICGRMDMKTYAAHIIARKIDALYLCSEIKSDEVKYVKQLLDNGIKVLTSPKFEHFEKEISKIDMATGDAVAAAVKMLASRGHKNIGFMGTFPENSKQDDRLARFTEAAKRENVNGVFVVPEDTVCATVENGAMLFDKLIRKDNAITAAIGLNDLIAIGAMNRAQQIGFCVPKDISFVGIDGIALSNLVSPRLTTYKSDAEILGKKAFEMLHNMIETGEISFYNHKMELMEGESVRDIR